MRTKQRIIVRRFPKVTERYLDLDRFVDVYIDDILYEKAKESGDMFHVLEEDYPIIEGLFGPKYVGLSDEGVPIITYADLDMANTEYYSSYESKHQPFIA